MISYTLNRFNISEEKINKVFEKLKTKDYWEVEYEIDKLLEQFILPSEVKDFSDDIKKWLNDCNVELTEEQNRNIYNYIIKYSVMYDSFINKYREILIDKQKYCKHTKITENIYCDHAKCLQCGKQVW